MPGESGETIPADERFLRAQLAVAGVAVSSLDPAILLPRLLEAVGRGLDYHYGWFWRIHEPENVAVAEAAFGEGVDAFVGLRQSLDDPTFFAGVVGRTHAPAFCNRWKDSPFAPHPVGSQLGAEAMIAVPVRGREGTLVGVFLFADSTNPERISTRDVGEGVVLANQVAQAIENADLFSRVRMLQHQYEVITESLEDVVFMVDGEGRFTFANRAAEGLTGYRLEDLAGRSFADIVALTDVAKLVDRFRRAVAGEPVPPRTEATIVRKDGQSVFLELTLSNLIVDGRVIGRVGVARDITERKREDAAQAMRSRLAALIADVGVAVSKGRSMSAMLEHCAEALVKHFGATAAQIWRVVHHGWVVRLEASATAGAGSDASDAATPIAEATISHIARERSPQLTRLAPGDAVDPDGTQVAAGAFAGYPLIVSDRVMGVMALLTRSPFRQADVEALKSVAVLIGQGIDRLAGEEALRDSEERFRSAFEDTGIGMALQYLDGRYMRVNRALCRMLGYDELELLERRFHDITHQDDLDVDRGFDHDTLLERRHVYQVEKRYIHKAGHVVWALVSVAVVRARDGRRLHFIVQAYDITERKQAEAAKVQLEDQLRQVQKIEAIGRLAGGIAHDFNNLLTVIIGRSERLLAHLRPDDALYRHAALIQKTGDRAAALTQQLLAFSRKQALDLQVHRLGGVVKGVEKMLRRLIGEHIELETRIDPGGWIRANPGQMEQVVLNLALNARDAMPDSGRLRIETSEVDLDESAVKSRGGTRAGRYVLLSVRDTGCGMPPETQAHLFEPFFTTKEPGQGTGLGLAIVYGVVTQAGGFIGVDSRPGRGTTFRIYFPCVEPNALAAGDVSAWGRAPAGSETILLVEDEADVRDLAREVLERQGYSVLEARHAREALRVSARYGEPIHLLLTDVVMPNGNGCALAAHLVSQRPGLRVLFMSGYTDDAIARHGLTGSARLVHKPFRSESLLREVRDMLDAPAIGIPDPGPRVAALPTGEPGRRQQDRREGPRRIERIRRNIKRCSS
ncbi:MAG: PAS domain S-box protein [Candidatus Rokuibacteriota bacterium]